MRSARSRSPATAVIAAASPTPRAEATREDGRALIEVVFLAVLLLIPTVYIMIGVLRLQAATLAVTQAARDAGRLIETSAAHPTLAQLTDVAAVALRDQHVPPDSLRIRTVAPGGDCAESDGTVIDVAADARYDLCVTAVISLPGVPTVLTGSHNTVTGVYAVHLGR